ncbi:hypothetical protein LTR10_019959 [Elasticomyces elasticus]|uniref:Uncharacterized protein n=1 Tax=Exophiala sideris TaxID=1016849 RepID=A0ABR0IXN3_9EURO|nr:hypothetical protein LTR10_019959 [Elasticomyces elasticus]KAK5022424.1 hypothetical protein LTS07_010084 [Exophiala sideris]KAK5027218.1 hypothetical protein LTR13_009613 [Exophiala sideris]KAK5051278.1 hypothetical protein LTR69_010304 [Exophiala sideris]KAK5177758.1 hypothetical protein LTR44_009733 [Eurotiomycetes sp. CCFEE 6388]
MRSIATLVIATLLAVAVQCSAEQEPDFAILPRYEDCTPSQSGGCAGCGADYVDCGADACYNPKANETCCANDYACPANFSCASNGTKCIPSDHHRRASSCRIGDEGFNGTAPNTTTTTRTITSTTTNTYTVNATTSSCDLSAATTGLPITDSALYGNATTTTVDLNTTTSTLLLANATAVLPTTNPINATRTSAAISPPITGYTGAASGLQGQSSASIFALGCLLFMSSLLL